MKICPLALMSGNTYRCNSSCAFSPGGECLLTVALKKYISEEPAAAVTYQHAFSGDNHSDVPCKFAPPMETKIP